MLQTPLKYLLFIAVICFTAVSCRSYKAIEINDNSFNLTTLAINDSVLISTKQVNEYLITVTSINGLSTVGKTTDNQTITVAL